MKNIMTLVLASIIMQACLSSSRGRLSESNPSAPDLTDVPAVLEVPGYGELNVINYSPPSSKKFIGSPSIVKLENGYLLASHDLFMPGDIQLGTFLFLSKDAGKTWFQVNGEPMTIHWANLFVHRKAVYLMGVDNKQGYSDVKIYRSNDNGFSWSPGSIVYKGKIHSAPVPTVIHNNRIYRAVEEHWGTAWGHYDAFVISAAVDADLLESSSWVGSSKVRYKDEWPGEAFLEGNVVIAPNDKLVNILRSHSTEGAEHAAVLELSDDGKSMSYKKHIPFSGGSKKFTIRFDSKSNKYWTLSNAILPTDPKNEKGGTERMRSRLTLMSSQDLNNWTMESHILYHDSPYLSGFQYVDWQFDGEDIIAAIRTSFAGAGSSHDANFFTFRRIERFRSLAAEPSVR